MKHIPLTLLSVFVLFAVSCKPSERYCYYKCFFIAETSFDIEGEVFTNDALTEKEDLYRITVKVDSIRNWEIEGVKETENKFALTVDTTANGITLSKDSISPDKEENPYYLSFPEDFPYCTLIFYVNGRRAKYAIEPDFGYPYYYVYIPESIDISEKTSESDSWFVTTYTYTYYDLNFSQPGWYKIYHSEDKKIGNKAAYSSGGNTKIRSPK